MKLSFSTVGCPDFSWDDIYSMAKDCGFQGIELRGLGDDIFSLRAKPFRPANIENTVKTLRDMGLSFSCLSSGCALRYGDKRSGNISELREYIDMAAKLSAPYVRVLGDEHSFSDGDVDDSIVLSQLCELAQYAEEKGVVLLVETNGVYADSKRLKGLLGQVKSDSIGALWDVHHTYRFFNEKPETTLQNLGAYIKHVHLKDSVMKNDTVVYRLMGDGDIPVDEIMMALSSINYDGFISLEWVKNYVPELENAGVVFPHFVNYMRRYIPDTQKTGDEEASDAVSERKREERCELAPEVLQDNLRGDGKYIWEKEKLINITFPELLDLVVKTFPDQYAFRYTTLDYTRTYREFADDVNNFARALIAMGVKAGDKVAIWATNVPQWFITFWATVKIGAVLVTVNTAYKIHEAEYLLRQSDTHTLVMTDGYKDSDYISIMKELCPELEGAEHREALFMKRLPFLRNIITCESKVEGCYTWEEANSLADTVPLEEVVRRQKAIHPDDVCNMQYTSGTTGFPKGVMLTHYNVVNNGKAIGDCMDFSTADRLLIQVPMFHCFGMVLAMTASVTHGVTMCPIPAFSPKKALDCIHREKITAVHGVPTMFITMLEHPDFEKTDFGSMRTGIMAGSPCPIKVMQEVIDKMGMRDICITYGQTEASPGCTMSKTSDSIEKRVETVGCNMFGVDCKIVDPETGADLPDGIDGEFVARGYNIMKGYYKMPAATAAVIDKDGWLHTGDLARRDRDGYYKITGRIKDMIIRGGENIYPKEIEDFIYTHPKVSDVQVIGVPDKQYGEEIMACVILKENESATAEEIKEFVMTHMAKHKTPRYVRFVDSFPMNAAGKILKYKMREDAASMIES